LHATICEPRRRFHFADGADEQDIDFSTEGGNCYFVSTVQEIQVAIQTLSPDQHGELERWWDAYQEKGWDAKLAHDSKPGGRLENILREIDADIDAGRVTSFPK
jgi:hypothetical protein